MFDVTGEVPLVPGTGCVSDLWLSLLLTGEGSSVGFSEHVQGKSPKARFAFSAHLYRSGAE